MYSLEQEEEGKGEKVEIYRQSWTIFAMRDERVYV